MAAPTKKTSSKSVTFSQDAADQTLLAAIEEEISDGHFASFSELCKQALQYFLFEEETPAATDPTQVGQTLAQLQSQFTGLGQQMEQMEAELKQSLSKPSSDSVSDEVSHLTQQIKQIDTRISQQLTQLQRQLDDFEPGAGSGIDPKQFRQLENQISYLTQQIDQIDGSTNQLLSQVENLTGLEPRGGVDAGSDSLSQIEDLVTDLMRKVEQMEAKTDRFLGQLQQALAEPEVEEEDTEEISPEAELLEQVEVRLAELLDRLERTVTSREAGAVRAARRSGVEEPEDLQESLVEPEKSEAADQDADPLLSRFSALLEDF
ncbi:hypothetical protein BST81_15665 [Leptolyngbya sp. 'hensonii']|uniref:hypothetical protein n=1 Tax=Leptolyngbya sp. 'hensonii' TaxID=1922337 RepID=UPI000950196F|nr:hypothetical protein [Leptolyngbya sp. 'hensonii']OLP17255.1 hypothetical protein BST81_15665 [Leptolyngbya sp. 'hensonii']